MHEISDCETLPLNTDDSNTCTIKQTRTCVHTPLCHQCEEGVSDGLTIGYFMKCASNPIPGLSLLFLHHPYMLIFGLLICLSVLSMQANEKSSGF